MALTFYTLTVFVFVATSNVMNETPQILHLNSLQAVIYDIKINTHKTSIHEVNAINFYLPSVIRTI